jgi:hypothetical protein
MVPHQRNICMHLASDYIHPTPRGGACRIRIYLPEDEQDAPVVICSELPYNEVHTPMVWIEHCPPETMDGRAKTFELVIFSSYEVKERAPKLGKTRLTEGEPTWKMLARNISPSTSPPLPAFSLSSNGRGAGSTGHCLLP